MGKSTHGFSNHHIYRSWRRIQSVCNDPKDKRYPRYGGRGIKCLWKSFEEFRDDMLPLYREHLKIHGRMDTTVERIDNDGHYCKENCRFATRAEQARNRKGTRRITFQGQTRSLIEWAEHLGIPNYALWLRIYRRKWSIEKAFTTPLMSTGNLKQITYKGVTRPLAEWAQIKGISIEIVWRRLHRKKWTIEKALETPVIRNKPSSL